MSGNSTFPSHEGNQPITARYLVAVDRLGPDGVAEGTVVDVVSQPSAAELELLSIVNGDTALSADRIRFVGGLPGEIVDVAVTWFAPRQAEQGRSQRRRHRRHAPAPTVRLVSIIESSPLRAQPKCAVFGECGGCQLQHMEYAAQLDWKTRRVQEALSGAGLGYVPVRPALGASLPWNYRNHMRFSVSRRGDIGLTARGSHRVLRLTDCPIAHRRINDVLQIAGELEAKPSPPQLLIRYSENSNQLLLQPKPDAEFTGKLAAAGIELREADMLESLGGQAFRIRPSSFFQTNTRQADSMVELVLGYVGDAKGQRWVDAYCGVGTFARLMADRVGEVIAIEESASAIKDARWNLRDVGNVTLVQGRVEEVLPDLRLDVDGLVIDPPRAGCRVPVLDALVARPLARLVYVSCNPDTLAQDLAFLTSTHPAYGVVSVQPLDMFPQTAHVETITLLEAR